VDVKETAMPSSPSAAGCVCTRLGCLAGAALVIGSSLPAVDQPPHFALICSGSTSDGGWNQLARDAMVDVAQRLGARLSVIQKVGTDEAANQMRAYASDGYALVIAHGYEFLVPAAEVAPSEPQTVFAVSGADEAKPHLTTIDYDLSEPSYQAGVLAALVSRSGHLGYIGGERIPSVLACERGFLAGAHRVRPDATVAEAYPGWDQPQAAKSQTEAFLHAGVDIVYQCVDAASKGVFEAIQEQDAQPGLPTAYVIGSIADQNANPICAAHTLASAVIRLDASFSSLATAVLAHQSAPGLIRENLARGTCQLVLNPALASDVISIPMHRAIEAAGHDLLSGAVTLPDR
jgi:basic membrane protein A